MKKKMCLKYKGNVSSVTLCLLEIISYSTCVTAHIRIHFDQGCPNIRMPLCVCVCVCVYIRGGMVHVLLLFYLF